jgi:DNA-binding CsgD family transcriptional regulator
VSLLKLLDIAEGLLSLDPVRTYPQRAAELIAQLVRANTYRLDLHGDGNGMAPERVVSEPAPPDDGRTVELPIRNGKHALGTLYLHPQDPSVRFGNDELRLARWGTRVLARGLTYAHRLASEGGRRSGERVSETLERAPLTPREREVAALVIAGVNTRHIAKRTGLTVSTVNTYLKRIFAKLGVHSRVELVARMAGTDGILNGGGDDAAFDGSMSEEEPEGRPSSIRRRVDLPGGVASTRPDPQVPAVGHGSAE